MGTRFWITILAIVALIVLGSVYVLQTSGSPRPTTYADIGPELGSGRIARSDAGFAVTTPPGWVAWQPSTGFQDWWGADTVVHLWLEPAPQTEQWWMGTCDIGETCTRERMTEAGGEAYCWVIDDTELATEAGWGDPGEPAKTIADGLAEQEGWSEIDAAIDALPGGEAGVLRAVDPNGWSQQIWHLTDDGRWFRLLCGLLESDVDPREIAASFEILPVGAG